MEIPFPHYTDHYTFFNISCTWIMEVIINPLKLFPTGPLWSAIISVDFACVLYIYIQILSFESYFFLKLYSKFLFWLKNDMKCVHQELMSRG